MAADGFCPKCGAVIYNGKCSGCGQGKGLFTTDNKKKDIQQVQKASSKAWVVVLVIIVLIFGGIAAIAVTMFSRMEDLVTGWTEVIPEQVLPEPEPVLPDRPISGIYDWSNGWNLEWGEDIEEDFIYEAYEPSPSDEYYEEIISTTVRGLDYDIAWNSSYFSPDDENASASYSVEYPIVIGSDAAFIEDINAAIYEEVFSYEMIDMTGDGFGYVDCYVTYMTSGILSVVFEYYTSQDDVYDYALSALNFDMITGEEIPMKEMLPKGDFVAQFRANCDKQNGYSSSIALEVMTDEEILNAITDPDFGVAFYNPVGVDVGFNYPDGWMTVTMK